MTGGGPEGCQHGALGFPCGICYPNWYRETYHSPYFGFNYTLPSATFSFVPPPRQKCPVCDGRGHHARGYYLDVPDATTITNAGPVVTCRTCNGTGLL